MRVYCESCDGKGYYEYPDYDWDENILDEGIRVECVDCSGQGYGFIPEVNLSEERNTLERLASFISTFDINESICKKYCKFADESDFDEYDCVDCIIKHFSSSCKWEQDDVCVNDKSEWCADFVDNVKCGRCKHYEIHG